MQNQTEQLTSFSYTDSELDIEQAYLYKLDVCVSANRVSFCVHQSKRVLGLKILQFRNAVSDDLHLLSDSIKNTDWHKASFAAVNVYFDNSRFTLVPEALFESDKAATYLNLVHKNIGQQQIITSKLPAHSAVCISGVDELVFKTFRTLFPSANFNHINAVALSIAAHYNSNELKNQLLVNIGEGFISVLYYQNNEIRFLNTFETGTDTDIVYYILSVASLLKLPADKFGIIVSGDVSNSSSVIGLMKKYIPEVLTINRLEDVQYPLSFREFQDQQHFFATHTLLCE